MSDDKHLDLHEASALFHAELWNGLAPRQALLSDELLAKWPPGKRASRREIVSGIESCDQNCLTSFFVSGELQAWSKQPRCESCREMVLDFEQVPFFPETAFSGAPLDTQWGKLEAGMPFVEKDSFSTWCNSFDPEQYVPAHRHQENRHQIRTLLVELVSDGSLSEYAARKLGDRWGLPFSLDAGEGEARREVLKVKNWTLAMALAWIQDRTWESVLQQSPDYRSTLGLRSVDPVLLERVSGPAINELVAGCHAGWIAATATDVEIGEPRCLTPDEWHGLSVEIDDELSDVWSYGSSGIYSGMRFSTENLLDRFSANPEERRKTSQRARGKFEDYLISEI